MVCERNRKVDGFLIFRFPALAFREAGRRQCRLPWRSRDLVWDSGFFECFPYRFGREIQVAFDTDRDFEDVLFPGVDLHQVEGNGNDCVFQLSEREASPLVMHEPGDVSEEDAVFRVILGGPPGGGTSGEEVFGDDKRIAVILRPADFLELSFQCLGHQLHIISREKSFSVSGLGDLFCADAVKGHLGCLIV